MFKFEIFVDVQDKRWEDNISGLPALVESSKNALLEVVAKDVWFLNKPKNFSINLALSDDKTVHALNKEFRGMDKPTNVLSFANVDDEFFETELEQEQDISLGDVIVAFETMASQAAELEVPFKDHFCHLWVHGMLHILGYDHIKDDERARMEALEIAALKKLGIDNPYQE
ncbi:MAG: rRNA maturation RNase YbeY [Alphaproteobacteria bacterium]|nr:rRNA maturation RNase YbeY [Alphaproteobacteria bacterium]